MLRREAEKEPTLRILSLALVMTALLIAPFAHSALAAFDDADDAVPTVDTVRAAFTALGAPPITEAPVLNTAPLADDIDSGSRFVIAPDATSNEASIYVGAYDIEEGMDERAEFQSAYSKVVAWGAQRDAGELKPTAASDLFNALEAYDGAYVSVSGSGPKNVTAIRLARYGSTIVIVSTDVDFKDPNSPENEIMMSAIVNTVLAKVIGDSSI